MGVLAYSSVILITFVCHRLAAARAHSGENNAPCCFLRPSCRFATLLREGFRVPLRRLVQMIKKKKENSDEFSFFVKLLLKQK